MAERRGILAAAGIIAVAATAAYYNSFGVPFVFDDLGSIVENPSIRQLWPLSVPLSPPGAAGETVGGRPVLNLSLAVNYAVSGLAPWSYHALNLAIHVAAGLVFFGLVRRVLPRVAGGRSFATETAPPAVAPDAAVPPYHLKVFATPTACVAALLWTLHPLHTQAVTYVIQRAESLMGLFYLLTLYAFVRMAGGGGWRWGAVSVGACLLAAGTKEVAVTAPLCVWLFDRALFSGGFRAALRKHPVYYAALAATWIPLAWLVLGTGADRGGTFAWSAEALGRYWLTQPEALTRYLGLALWPHPLVFEYGVATHSGPLVTVGCSLLMVCFVGLTAWLWRRQRPEALGLVAFLLVLAPTSLMAGAQIIVEHRMYLPLAGLVAVFVAATMAWVGRRGLLLCFGLAVAGGVATSARNAVYHDPLALWTDTVEKRPTSAKAHNNLGLLRYLRGELEPAIRHYEEAVKLEPEAAQAWFNLGLARQQAGQTAQARAAYAEAVRLVPTLAQARAQLGIVLVREGRPQEAAEQLQAAYALNPDLAETHLGYGLLLAGAGRDGEAVAAFEAALQRAPGLGEARWRLGAALTRLGRLPEAVRELRQAVRESPATAEAHAHLGLALAASGEFESAVASYHEAIRLQADYANAHYNLGNACIELRRWREARQAFEAALRLEPDFAAAREMVERMKAARLPE